MRKPIIRGPFWRKYKSTVAHWEGTCHYVTIMLRNGTKVTLSDKKPPGCTLCDTCQHIERQRRKAK